MHIIDFGKFTDIIHMNLNKLESPRSHMDGEKRGRFKGNAD